MFIWLSLFEGAGSEMLFVIPVSRNNEFLLPLYDCLIQPFFFFFFFVEV